MSEDAEQPSIKVKDRRRFSADGEPLDNPEASEAQESTSSEASAEKAAPPPPSVDPGSLPQQPPIPTASFELLVLSLGMQAQMELSAPGGDDAPAPNLDMARHTIDLLGILQEKTKGNLSFEESRQLENTLTELRFRYVQRVNEINTKAKG